MNNVRVNCGADPKPLNNGPSLMMILKKNNDAVDGKIGIILKMP
jgi:hypothetical protein